MTAPSTARPSAIDVWGFHSATSMALGGEDPTVAFMQAANAAARDRGIDPTKPSDALDLSRDCILDDATTATDYNWQIHAGTLYLWSAALGPDMPDALARRM
jgi:hypothetical protein